MAGYTVPARNLMLDALAAAAGFVSLHSADPGLVGDAELSGGTPAYVRQGMVWVPASAAVLESLSAVTWNVPADSTVRFWGAWSAASGGTFYGSGPLRAEEFFPIQGTYTADSGRLRMRLV